MNDALIRLVLIVIAAITVLSGLTQCFAPGLVLGFIGGGIDNPPAAQAFATVGMFMTITGAMFLQSLVTRSAEPAIPLWIAVQKLAAAVLVALAVTRGLFGGLAIAVAAFDGLTGVLTFVFWKRLPR